MIVDYIGIAKALKDAMNDYTVRDRANFDNPDIREQVYPMFAEKLEVCSNEFFHGFNYSSIFDEDFIMGIAEMKQKNLAIELMNK